MTEDVLKPVPSLDPQTPDSLLEQNIVKGIHEGMVLPTPEAICSSRPIFNALLMKIRTADESEKEHLYVTLAHYLRELDTQKEHIRTSTEIRDEHIIAQGTYASIMGAGAASLLSGSFHAMVVFFIGKALESMARNQLKNDQKNTLEQLSFMKKMILSEMKRTGIEY